ncbi:hypothetical protein FGO68_gene12687 [Halteria grandinella]|uniref:Uncharacterized protein n=1 Tax=Halteria grandinella TaxID=5974 RepID=A0A8J8NQK6_HALGN|nr:hypothetical protein FGO68_gene12687 [Halteria grandinella]
MKGHGGWVTCMEVGEIVEGDQTREFLISGSRDKSLMVWDNQTMTLKHTFVGHTAQVNSLSMVPKTNFLASGGKDGNVIIWDLVNGKFLAKQEVDCPVNVVLFAPKKYWLIVGTEQGIKILDLPSKEFIADIKATPLDASREKSTAPIGCTSLAWNKSGNVLFAGFTDNYIRVYKIVVSA